MKVVILAGGLGTRISEETTVRPKPMVEVGGMPILWHLMKVYSFHGLNDFVICLGYKGDYIKEYFANYALRRSDVEFDIRANSMKLSRGELEPWRITCVETGASSMTGGRLRRVRHLIDETFCFTYGDGVGTIDIPGSIAFHRQHGCLATLTAVQPHGRFGALEFAESTRVARFHEKPKGDGGWVNGGFFVLEPGVIDYIDGDDAVWEQAPLQRLSRDGQLHAWRHDGFWQSVDTLRDKQLLAELWESGKPPWKLWDD